MNTEQFEERTEAGDISLSPSDDVGTLGSARFVSEHPRVVPCPDDVWRNQYVMLRSILMREEESPYTNNLPRHHSLGRDFAVRRGASDR